MKRILAVLTALALYLPVSAYGASADYPLIPSASQSVEATTDLGTRVILYPDGTWDYVVIVQPEPDTYTKPITSTRVFKSKKGFYEIWFDPMKWKTEGLQHSDAEFNIAHVSGDAYAIAIAERITMSLEALRESALENARKAAPDAQIVAERDITVNGIPVKNLQIEGTIENIPFTYFGYYWAGKAGTLQVIAFTGQNLFDEFMPEFRELLNGLIVTKP